MAVANLTTHANAIQTIYAGVVEGVFSNSAIFQLLGEPGPRSNVGDRYFTWGVHSSGNSSVEVFSEDTAYPTAVAQTVVKAYVSPVYVRAAIEITGILRDALGSGGNYGAFDLEMSAAAAQLRDLLTTSFLGGTYGLELAIDYGSAYAGITRNSAAAYFESTETDVDDALELADLEDLLETIRNADKAGNPSHLVMNHNQVTNYKRLSPNSFMGMAAPNDKGLNSYALTFEGIPIVPTADVTSTVIMACDFNPGEVAWETWRPFSVKPLGDTDDNSKFQLSAGLMMAILNPRHHGKLTGVTA